MDESTFVEVHDELKSEIIGEDEEVEGPEKDPLAIDEDEEAVDPEDNDHGDKGCKPDARDAVESDDDAVEDDDDYNPVKPVKPVMPVKETTKRKTGPKPKRVLKGVVDFWLFLSIFKSTFKHRFLYSLECRLKNEISLNTLVYF